MGKPNLHCGDAVWLELISSSFASSILDRFNLMINENNVAKLLLISSKMVLMYIFREKPIHSVVKARGDLFNIMSSNYSILFFITCRHTILDL